MKRFFLSFIVILFALIINAGNEKTNDVLGPHPIQYDVPTPEGYSKVIVSSNPEFTGGSVTLSNIETSEICMLAGSVTYMNMWYFFIPNGTYTVESIADGYTATSNGGAISVGSTLKFNGGGYVFFTLIDSGSN